MLFRTIFYLISSSLGKLIIHSPDVLQDLEIPYGYANFGNPALIPKYGKVQYEHLSECAFEGNVKSNSVLVLEADKENSCHFSLMIMSAYKAKATFILILQPYDEIYNMSSSYYTDEMYEDFTALLIKKKIYTDYFSKFKNVWLSYEYDYKKSDSPNIELILSGNRNQEYYIVKDLLNVINNYHLDYDQFNIRIAYSNSINFIVEDCIIYNLKSYCAYMVPTASGSLVLENLLASLTFFDSLPPNIQPVRAFLEYLLYLYNKCDQDYTINCNYDSIIDNGGQPNYNENLILNAKFFSDPDSHLVINGKYFPWSGTIELGYCSSFYEMPYNCPYCSSGCYFDVQSLESCVIGCNNTDCGYSNLNCLETESTDCYYFMLNDGNCNNECGLEEDCLGDNDEDDDENSNQGTENTSFQNDDVRNTIILIAVLVPISFCICGIIVIIRIRYVANRNKRNLDVVQNLKVSPVRYDNSMKIFGDNICVIDLIRIYDGDLAIITPCKHIFHPQCIKEWLDNSHNIDKSCPVCHEPLAAYII